MGASVRVRDYEEEFAGKKEVQNPGMDETNDEDKTDGGSSQFISGIVSSPSSVFDSMFPNGVEVRDKGISGPVATSSQHSVGGVSSFFINFAKFGKKSVKTSIYSSKGISTGFPKTSTTSSGSISSSSK